MPEKLNPEVGDLPRARTDRPTRAPVESPWLVHRLAEAWHETYDDAMAEHAIPEAGPYRASWADKRCDRALAYALAGAEQSDKPTIADQWRFALGTLIHDGLDDAIEKLHPSAERDKPFDLRPIVGIPGSGRADCFDPAFVPPADVGLSGEPLRLVAEYKSVNGFKFKMAASNFKSPPQGPDFGHIVQGALAAAELEADVLVIGYLSLENLSPDIASKVASSNTDLARFTGEWHFGPKVIDRLVGIEAERVNGLLKFLEENPPSEVPRALIEPEHGAGTIVADPMKGNTVTLDDQGRVIDTKRTWRCSYCSYCSRCVLDGPGKGAA